MSHLSRVPVVFEDSSACVHFQPPNEGWKIVADAQQCNVSIDNKLLFKVQIFLFVVFEGGY